MRRFVIVTAILSLTAVASNYAFDDWPQWRGQKRDGTSAERGLLKDWPAGGPPLAWRTNGAGTGYSSFSTAHGRIYTLGARGGTEYLMAYDAATGKKVWEIAHGRRFGNDMGDGPRSTPTVDGDRLYTFGASGDLSVVEAATGKVFWKMNLLEKFGGSNIRWGLSESPLVLSDRILVSPGGRGAAIVALNKTEGSVIWKSLGDEPGYSSAILHEANGVREAIYFTGERALGIDVETGKLLWSYNQVANQTANIATPIVRGNFVFVSSAYGTGAALLELTPAPNKVSARQVYFTRDMRNHHATSVLDRRLPLWVFRRYPDGDEVRLGPDRMARSERWQRVGRVRRRSTVSLQRTGRRRPGGSQSCRLQGAWTIPDSGRRLADLESPDRFQRQALHSRSGQYLRV